MNQQDAELTLLLAKTGEPSVDFNTAFQAARVLGRDVFKWRGGDYTAQTAEEAKAARRLPRGMKESDLYRNPAEERINEDLYNQMRAIDQEHRQTLRDISYDRTQSEKNALRGLTSNMAPFEQNQLALRNLGQHMAQMRKYEADEYVQGRLGEEMYKTELSRDELNRLQKELAYYESMLRMQNYEREEQKAQEQHRMNQLAATYQPKEPPLEPLYPELLLPGLPRALRASFGAVDRLRAGRRPPPERIEPTFNLNTLMAP